MPSIESEVNTEDNEDQERIYKRFIQDIEEEFGKIDNTKEAIQNKLKLDIKPNNYDFDQIKDL